MMTFFKNISKLLFILLIATSTVMSQENNEVIHITQPGENLFRIGLQYGVTIDELASVNNITNTSTVYAGQKIIIPGLVLPSSPDEPLENNVPDNSLVAVAPINHIIQRGETLTQIAEIYGVSVDVIMRANNITDASRIFSGTELQIWAPNYLEQNSGLSTDDTQVATATDQSVSSVPHDSIESVIYTVRAGETLIQIARKFEVSWLVLADVNGITDSDSIYEGMVLNIPKRPDSIPAEVQYATYNNILPATTDPGPRIGVGREIVVVLSTQMTYAYEDGKLKYSALVSTGLPATPTVQGDFRIWNKTRIQTMSGPGYYLENVEWVMYFFEGYGFHGTWWHDNFGQPMSAGCVNMTNEDAKWLYEFASVGTPVYVRFY